MANMTSAYKRLPGTGYHYRIPQWAMVLLFFVLGIFVLLFRGRRTQLWIGVEHLLMVESDGYTEYYKRFAYGDIQAFVIRRTVQGRIVNAMLGGLTLILFALALAVDDLVGRSLLLVGSGLFGLLLLINFLRGPTCQCQLRTAVQMIDMVSLNRLRTARKALAAIRPLIEQAQGPINPVAASVFPQPPLAGGTTGTHLSA